MMNFNNWNYQSTQNPTYGNYQSPINTNKIYVTSLDDALSRPAPRQSEMVYFHQDANEFYVVKTDVDGRKSWIGFPYLMPNQDARTPATKADLQELISRIEKLEGKGEVVTDA